MSRYNFGNGRYFGVIGSDKPLMNVFMEIEENGVEDPVFDSMNEKDYFTQQDIRVYAEKAKQQFGINVPETLLVKVENEMKELKENYEKDSISGHTIPKRF